MVSFMNKALETKFEFQKQIGVCKDLQDAAEWIAARSAEQVCKLQRVECICFSLRVLGECRTRGNNVAIGTPCSSLQAIRQAKAWFKNSDCAVKKVPLFA